jgi:hypothetical protein
LEHILLELTRILAQVSRAHTLVAILLVVQSALLVGGFVALGRMVWRSEQMTAEVLRRIPER